VREWIDSLGEIHPGAAVFDTHIKAPLGVSGRASKSIRRELLRHGLSLVAPAESFLVDRKNHLLTGEVARARQWGENLARIVENRRSKAT